MGNQASIRGIRRLLCDTPNRANGVHENRAQTIRPRGAGTTRCTTSTRKFGPPRNPATMIALSPAPRSSAPRCSSSCAQSHVRIRGRLTSTWAWRRDWLAGLRGLELREYRFEMSRGFPAIQPNLDTRDYSRTSCKNWTYLRCGAYRVTAGRAWRTRTGLCPPFLEIRRRSRG